MSTTADLIRARVAELEERLRQNELAAQVMREERAELLTTLKVLSRFGEEEEVRTPEPDIDARMVSPEGQVVEVQAKSTRPTKPEGTPTVPEMIKEILLRPFLLGDPGMEPKDITAKIRERWWPDAPSQSVGPIAWRMWKDGKLVKDGELYALPPDPQPSQSLFDDALNPREATTV